MELQIEKLNLKIAENTEGSIHPKKHRVPFLNLLLLIICISLAQVDYFQKRQLNKLQSLPLQLVSGGKNHSPSKTILTPPIKKPEAPTNSEPQPTDQAYVFKTEDTNTSDLTGPIIEEALKNKNIEDQKKVKNWNLATPYYRKMLSVLHDVLLNKASKCGDDIVQNSDYYSCLPSSIDPAKESEISLAKIGLKNNTNWDFSISLRPNGDHQLFRIQCQTSWSEAYVDEGLITYWLELQNGYGHIEKTEVITNSDAMIKSFIESMANQQQKQFPLK